MSEAMWREAEESGFLTAGLVASAFPADRGWHAAILFAGQAQAALAGIEPEDERQINRVLEAIAEWPEPLWRGLCRAAALLRDREPHGLCQGLLPLAATLDEAERDLLILPYVGVIAAQEAENLGCAEEHGQLAGETLAWLLACVWALDAARHPGQVITCFSERGPIRHEIAERDLDRYLLRAFLNDVPMLQASSQLACNLPRRAEEWLVCDAVLLAELEGELGRWVWRGPSLACDWPDRIWSCRLGRWRATFGPRLRHPLFDEIVIGLVETHVGAFTVEVCFDEHSLPRVANLPLRNTTAALNERIELFEERLECAIHAALSAQPGAISG